MAQVDFTQLTTQWTAFSDITTVDANSTYSIQNRGAFPIIALEANSLPDSNDMDGNILLPNMVAKYKKGSQNLYLRSFNSVTSINVTVEG